MTTVPQIMLDYQFCDDSLRWPGTCMAHSIVHCEPHWKGLVIAGMPELWDWIKEHKWVVNTTSINPWSVPGDILADDLWINTRIRDLDKVTNPMLGVVISERHAAPVHDGILHDCDRRLLHEFIAAWLSPAHAL